VDRFLSSLSVDKRLLPEDIECSAAHAAMLGEEGILSQNQADALVAALKSMADQAAAGTLAVDPSSEDVHSFIEAELTRRLGDAGKAIHAGRSRNDQVAVAFRLHILRAYDGAMEAVRRAIAAILDLASKHTETMMPGYTHLQRAQPVTLAHHLLAWAAALERDYGRLADGRARANECPLGSGALAGSGLPTNRERTAELLGFSRPCRNTMDAVADRDSCVEFAAACATIGIHLSRASEDIALWVSTEYGFASIGDAASTGSSIMPQKRNPDPAELLRGKTGRLLGGLQALLVMQKGLPYAYNRDLQEDKETFFDIEDTTVASLGSFAILVSSLTPCVDTMKAAVADGYLEATDVAEYLVGLKVPFRTAYLATKNLIAKATSKKARLSSLSDEDIRAADPVFNEKAFDPAALRAYLDPWACVLRRDQPGGPAPYRTKEEIARLKSIYGV
jgi:argininosuccinate lyase